jgi:hypothetical protein
MKLLLQKHNLLALLAAILMMVACSEQKKLQKAQQVVLTNDGAFNYIGGKWAKLNPCVIDSVVKYSTSEIIKTDTFYKHGDIVTAPAAYDTIIVHRNIDHYDTARIYIRDRRLEFMLLDSVNFYKLANSKSQTAYEVVKQDDARKSKLLLFWIVLFAVENIGILLYKAKTI